MLFSSTLYVKVYSNRLVLRQLERGENLELTANPAFTTTRLLVGEFSVAQLLLKQAVAALIGKCLQLFGPKVVIHPLEKIEGGLSQIEERLFLELAYGAGAKAAKVYLGPELSDDAVRAQLKAK